MFIPLGITVALIALFLIIFIWSLFFLRKRGIVSDQFFEQTSSSVVSQVIGGCLIAFVSFWAAYYQFESHENEKGRVAKLENVINLQNEISENLFSIEMALKKERFDIMMPLKTEIWETRKYHLDLETPNLWGSLAILYNKIDQYNYMNPMLRAGVMKETIRGHDLSEAFEVQKKLFNLLASNLVDARKLMERELVFKHHKSKEDYENKYGKWTDKVVIPFTTDEELKN